MVERFARKDVAWLLPLLTRLAQPPELSALAAIRESHNQFTLDALELVRSLRSLACNADVHCVVARTLLLLPVSLSGTASHRRIRNEQQQWCAKARILQQLLEQENLCEALEISRCIC